MPNQRAPGQKPVIVVLKDEFLQRIDANLGKMGFSDRSSFIRTAVLEKLGRVTPVPPEMATAPSRAGKGGRPKKIVTPESGGEKKAKTATKKAPKP